MPRSQTEKTSPRSARQQRRLTTALSATLVLGTGLAVIAGPTAGATSTTDRVVAVAKAEAQKAEAQPTGHARITPLTASFFPNHPGTITGLLGTQRVRPVHLQRLVNGKWTHLKTVDTKADGTFAFTGVKLGSTAQIRVEAKPIEFVGGIPLTEAEKAEQAAKKELRKAESVLDKAKRSLEKARNRLKRARALGLKRNVIRARKQAVQAAEARLADAVAGRNEERRDFNQAARQADRPPTTLKWSISPTVTVLVENQRITIGDVPPITQPGRAPLAAPGAGAPQVYVNVRVVPARAGREVTLATVIDGKAVPGPKQVTDASGNVLFPTTPGLVHEASVSAGQGGPVGTSARVTARDFSVDFEDQFDTNALDERKWTFQERHLGNGLRTCAITDGSSSKVSGGILSMGVSKDPKRLHEKCRHTTPSGEVHELPYMRNTQIDSQGKYSFTYGFAAARMRPQAAEGMHSAFWSHPNRALTAGAPGQGVEIDVMEFFGDDFHQKGIGTYTHVAEPNGEVVKTGEVYGITQSLLMAGSESFSDQFSVFSVEWTPTQYVFRVDGREYLRKTTNLSHAPQFLALSNLTSSWELMDLEDFSSTADVDWVRVYK